MENLSGSDTKEISEEASILYAASQKVDFKDNDYNESNQKLNRIRQYTFIA